LYFRRALSSVVVFPHLLFVLFVQGNLTIVNVSIRVLVGVVFTSSQGLIDFRFSSNSVRATDAR
jgi:hypothetical protein